MRLAGGGWRTGLLGIPLVVAAVGASCAAASRRSSPGSGGSSGTSTGSGSGGAASSSSGSTSTSISFDAPQCADTCSIDQHTIVDCHGNVVQTCGDTQACQASTLTCIDACSAAVANKAAIGCEYYATFMDQILGDVCFAAIVTNTWGTPVHIQVDYQGAPLTVADFARIPSGFGASTGAKDAGPVLNYAPYDPVGGLPAGQVAILFLSGDPNGAVACPVPAAVPTGVMHKNTTTIADAFHITTDLPIVAYQINPYGGGYAQTTGASLLLPTSVWDTNYVAVNVSAYDTSSDQDLDPSLNIVAAADGTVVTMLPIADVDGGGGVPAALAGQPLSFTLNQGQHAQITQPGELTGSIVQSNKPVGLMAGQVCERHPIGVQFCDHGEQMIPPVQALGSEYVGVPYRPRIPTELSVSWRIVGTVDGTELTWTPAVGGPSTLKKGQVVDWDTGTPFHVTSQDSEHPFMIFTYMSGNQLLPGLTGIGDPDFVLDIPPQQYLTRYVFFADPTYPETNLVIVRMKSQADMTYKDVTLDCAGAVGGWTQLGDYQWTRVDLSTGNFKTVNGCSNGAHQISSDAPFGLWVWGWGSPLTNPVYTQDVSYGYPGGMNVQHINRVVIPPMTQ